MTWWIATWDIIKHCPDGSDSFSSLSYLVNFPACNLSLACTAPFLPLTQLGLVWNFPMPEIQFSNRVINSLPFNGYFPLATQQWCHPLPGFRVCPKTILSFSSVPKAPLPARKASCWDGMIEPFLKGHSSCIQNTDTEVWTAESLNSLLYCNGDNKGTSLISVPRLRYFEAIPIFSTGEKETLQKICWMAREE